MTPKPNKYKVTRHTPEELKALLDDAKPAVFQIGSNKNLVFIQS
ncbi:MAG: hypothetical protein ACTSSH_00770 [Candidatus Heimdallarchaeota archaeon]